jgi:hypothetical protein
MPGTGHELPLELRNKLGLGVGIASGLEIHNIFASADAAACATDPPSRILTFGRVVTEVAASNHVFRMGLGNLIQ